MPVQFGLESGFPFQQYLGFSRYKAGKMLYKALFTSHGPHSHILMTGGVGSERLFWGSEIWPKVNFLCL